MCPDGRNRQLQQIRLCRTTTVIDILAIRRTADRYHLGTQRRQRPRADLIAGTVRPVENYLQPREINPVSDAGSAKILVARPGCIDAFRLPQRLRLQRNGGILKVLFNLSLDLVGQLRPGTVKKLDAVVKIRVMRCADNDTEIRVKLLRQSGDTGRGQRTD